MLSGFSRQYDYRLCWIAPRGAPYFQVRIGRRICLSSSTPTPFNAVFRHRAALSLLRLHVAPRVSTEFLIRSSIGFALRLILRSRLTLIRLALIRKPWSFGGRVSRPPYRYLYLHLLFHALQNPSRVSLQRRMECSPTDVLRHPAASAACLCPIIIHATSLD
jgi:hypothetical protein